MGSGCKMVCPDCGYGFDRSEGVGFLFPVEYKKAVEKAKAGKLGKKIKLFFEEHADGAIDASYVTLCCDECGFLKSGMYLTMYVPKNGMQPPKGKKMWSIPCPGEGIDYVDNSDLETYYVEFMRYPHKCGKCRGKMHIVQQEEELKCLKCKAKMEEDKFILWD